MPELSGRIQSPKEAWPIYRRPHPCQPQDARSRQSCYTHFRSHHTETVEEEQQEVEKSTRQMVYVSISTNNLFLSREACVDLGIIPQEFPTMDNTNQTSSSNSIAATTGPDSPIDDTTAPLPQQDCHCPRRTKLPSPPTSLPYPATEASREKLQ